MILIDGKKISADLKDKLSKEISLLKEKHKAVPGLAVVQVGSVAASSVYVKAKTKSAKEVGIQVFDYHLDEKVSENELIKLINELNNSLINYYIGYIYIYVYERGAKVKCPKAAVT